VTITTLSQSYRAALTILKYSPIALFRTSCFRQIRVRRPRAVWLWAASMVWTGVSEAALPNEALISIVDDDESVREALTGLMKSLGFAVEAFPSAQDFLSSPHLHNTSCVIADVHMPAMSGVELHNSLVGAGHQIPTILITAYSDDVLRSRALKDGVIGYLSKPFDEASLLGCVQLALKQSRSTDTPS